MKKKTTKAKLNIFVRVKKKGDINKNLDACIFEIRMPYICTYMYVTYTCVILMNNSISHHHILKLHI